MGEGGGGPWLPRKVILGAISCRELPWSSLGPYSAPQMKYCAVWKGAAVRWASHTSNEYLPAPDWERSVFLGGRQIRMPKHMLFQH